MERWLLLMLRTCPNNEIVQLLKVVGDAKLELFPGARPPDTTFGS